MKAKLHYSMVIRWSEEDQVYIAHLPEFGPYTKTHGSSYEEAARMGQEVLEMLVESYPKDQTPLPVPRLYADAGTEQSTKPSVELTSREHLQRAGKVKSSAKSAASQANGKKGGRPRKISQSSLKNFRNSKVNTNGVA